MLTMFSSRTGSDTIHVIEALKRGDIPDHSIQDVGQVVTNNIKSPLIEYCYVNNINVSLLPNRPTLRNYDELGIPEEDTVLLMGYLRVLPAEFCHLHRNTYNLHPGDITVYPELKGLDPQKRAFAGNYPTVGCVIHRVVAEVDAGDIMLSGSFMNVFGSLSGIYEALGHMAKGMWVDFLRENEW